MLAASAAAEERLSRELARRPRPRGPREGRPARRRPFRRAAAAPRVGVSCAAVAHSAETRLPRRRRGVDVDIPWGRNNSRPSSTILTTWIAGNSSASSRLLVFPRPPPPQAPLVDRTNSTVRRTKDLLTAMHDETSAARGKTKASARPRGIFVALGSRVAADTVLVRTDATAAFSSNRARADAPALGSVLTHRPLVPYRSTSPWFVRTPATPPRRSEARIRENLANTLARRRAGDGAVGAPGERALGGARRARVRGRPARAR